MVNDTCLMASVELC